MRSPSSIAFIAAVVTVVSMLATSAVTAHFEDFAYVALSAVVLGAVIGVGTYLGARWAPAEQRTKRLAWFLGLLYLFAGVLMSLPIKTHAVVIDMPSGADDAGFMTRVAAAAGAVALYLMPLVVPVVVARALAAACATRVARDA